MPKQEIKLCTNDMSHGVAIGGHRSSDYCRPCYITYVEATGDLVEVEVIGDLQVTGLDGVGRGKGERVKLDPQETKILALVYAGLARVLPAAQAKAAKAKD